MALQTDQAQAGETHGESCQLKQPANSVPSGPRTTSSTIFMFLLGEVRFFSPKRWCVNMQTQFPGIFYFLLLLFRYCCKEPD